MGEVNCIYCGRKNKITESDIVPDFMTNGKLKRTNVCTECNEICSKQFESKVSKELSDITNHLDIKNSKNNKISQSTVRFEIDNKVFQKKITSKSDIFSGISKGESNGVKYQFGPVENFKKRSKFDESKLINFSSGTKVIRIIDFEENVYNSNEMLRMIAKISYEYYCRQNEIDEKKDEFQTIINFIICNSVDTSNYAGLIEVVTDESLYDSINKSDGADIGGHSFAIGITQDGREYVIFSLFGLVIYKVWIKINPSIHYNKNKIGDFFIIRADGSRDWVKKLTDSAYEAPSKNPHEGLSEVFHLSAKYFEKIISTSFVSLRVMKRHIDTIFKIANMDESDVRYDKLIGYNDPKIIDGIYILKKLVESENMIDFNKSFNWNIQRIIGNDDVHKIDTNEIIQVLSTEYYGGSFMDSIKRGYSIFMRFYNQEVK